MSAGVPHDNHSPVEGDALAELERWLAWSGGQYPDDSPGDVIHAQADGTITLDDGIATWNPLRALAWFEQRAREHETMRDALRLAVDILDDVWSQFAIDGKNGKWAGGLSTLEWVCDELPNLRAALAGSRAATPEADCTCDRFPNTPRCSPELARERGCAATPEDGQ